MNTDIIEALKCGKIILWEYDFDNTVNSPEIESTKQQIPKSMYFGTKQGTHYYGFYHNEKRYIIAVDNRDKKNRHIRIGNIETQESIKISVNDWEKIYNRDKKYIKNANRAINNYHKIQDTFPKQWILAVILLSSVLILSIIKQDFIFLGIMATNVSAIMACEDLTNIYAKLFFKKRSFAFRYVFHFFKCAFYFSSVVELFFEINDNLNYASMFGSIFTVIGAIFIIGELLIRKHSFAKI